MRRNRERFYRWWLTGLAIFNAVFAPFVDDLALRWFDTACGVIFAFVAGWLWREWTAHKRVMRLAETDAWQTAIRNETRDL